MASETDCDEICKQKSKVNRFIIQAKVKLLGIVKFYPFDPKRSCRAIILMLTVAGGLEIIARFCQLGDLNSY